MVHAFPFKPARFQFRVAVPDVTRSIAQPTVMHHTPLLHAENELHSKSFWQDDF